MGYEDEADSSEEQFNNLLWQQTEYNTEERSPTDNTEVTSTVNNVEDRSTANNAEESISAKPLSA